MVALFKGDPIESLWRMGISIFFHSVRDRSFSLRKEGGEKDAR
jgi:hypothetical protein